MIAVMRDGKKAVLRPAGETIVARTIPELRVQLRGLVDGGVNDLVIDLADVRLVDSSGIGLLISAHNSLRKEGGKLALIHASADLLDLFQSMRMHQHFSVSGTAGKAEELIRGEDEQS